MFNFLPWFTQLSFFFKWHNINYNMITKVKCLKRNLLKKTISDLRISRVRLKYCWTKPGKILQWQIIANCQRTMSSSISWSAIEFKNFQPLRQKGKVSYNCKHPGNNWFWFSYPALQPSFSFPVRRKWPMPWPGYIRCPLFSAIIPCPIWPTPKACYLPA